MEDSKAPHLRCPHFAGPLSKKMETSSWNNSPLIRDSFSMVTMNSIHLGSIPALTSTTSPHENEDENEDEVATINQVETLSTASSSLPNSTNKVSIVWSHCDKFFKFNPNYPAIKEFPYAKCRTCLAEFPAHSKHNGTTNIKNHLKFSCVKCLVYEGGNKGKRQTTLSQEAMGAPLVPHTFNQKRHEQKVFKWIVRDEQTFRVVEGVGFKEMIHDLCPKFKIPDRKRVVAGIFELYMLEKAKIMSVIGNQRVSITTDTWTSIQNINYMVVTAHFMDADWKLHKRIINFCKINSHKGEDIGRTLEACLRSWGIDKIFSITVDNASANDDAVDYMKQRLRENNNLLFDGIYLHVRCSCHIINLIVKDGLKELFVSIEAVRNCVKYIHSSPARLDKFREFASFLKLGEMALIPLDVTTRWNSTYKMLESAVKYKLVFNRMSEEYMPFMDYFQEKDKNGELIRVGPPVEEDWERANAIMHFLKQFYDATLVLSATKTCTSLLFFDQISNLELEILEKMRDSNEVMRNVSQSMMLKFKKYWGKFDQVNKLVYVAHVLNPRMKLQMIGIAFEELGKSPQEIEDIVKEIKSCLLDLYNAYKGDSPSIVHPSTSTAVVEEVGLSRLELSLKRKRMEEETTEITNEVDRYLSDPFEKLDHKGFDLLEWWKCNQSWYPVLSKVAKDLFSIPSSTVASENAFSLGGRIVDPFRASLTPKIVEALVCTSDWLRAEDFNFYKEPTDEEVEFYRELEELEPKDTSTSQSFASA